MYEKIRHRKLKYLPSVIPLANKFTDVRTSRKLNLERRWKLKVKN